MKHFPRVFVAGLCALFLPVFTIRAETPASGANAANAAPAQRAAETTEPDGVLMIVYELYALAKDDAHAVLEDKHSSEDRYQHLLDLERSGRARLETLTALPTRSGQRAVNESCDEVRFATEFAPANGRGEFATPTAFETRNAGDTFEIEPVLRPDNHYCDINLVPQRVSFAGFHDLAGMGDDPPVSQPRFIVQKLTTSTTATLDHIHFLGTLTPPSASDAANGGRPSEVWLAFLHVHNLSVAKALKEMKPFDKSPDGFGIDMEYSFYSLDRGVARDLLATHPKLDTSWERLQGLLKQGKARFEHIVSVKSKSGQRAATEETNEIRYGTEYAVPGVRRSRETTKHSGGPVAAAPVAKGQAQANGPATVPEETTTVEREIPTTEGTPGATTAFETRNTGVSVEVEPAIGPDGATIDINTAVQISADLGNLRTTGAAMRYPAQPLFEVRKITTSIMTVLGSHALLGTLSMPGADGVNGRVDTGRTWLLFLRVMPSEL